MNATDYMKRNILWFYTYYVYILIYTPIHAHKHTYEGNMCIRATGKTFFILSH